MSVSMKSLLSRLNETCRASLEGALGLCLSRTHYEVEVEHLLLKLLETPSTDLDHILRHFEINSSRANKALTQALDRFKTGNGRNPVISSQLIKMVQEGWLFGSLEYGSAKIRSGHLVIGLLSNEDLARMVQDISPDFSSISVDALVKKFQTITDGSVEEKAAVGLGEKPAMDSSGSPVANKTQALDQYTVDLTAKAREGHIDPVLGRDFEIRQIVDILTRRRQNNPIMTGEAGVGKTAVVEGFALRIAQGDVPGPLKNVVVKTLDLGLLQAGAGIKGEFESRLKTLIEEVKGSPQPIILFIDEAHTMIGAGGQAGQGDAANLLKPALARGELRTIAATTWAEYKKYFEKDPALTRRFQVVKVEEPSEEQAIIMMRALTETLENHHKVRILDEAIEDAVKLSHRYITGRQLPDKCVSVLDTACARVAIGQAATPGPIEDANRRINQLGVEINVLEREAVIGADHRDRIEERKTDRAQEEERLTQLQTQWEREQELIGNIRDIRTTLEAQALGSKKKDESSDNVETNISEPPQINVEALRAELSKLNDELVAIQGETPLMQACVTSQTIGEVISGWTGIPVGKMLTDEINTVLTLKDKLEQRVIGQSHALEAISQRIQTARADLTDPRRPVGVFLLVGPSGVGKTETALTLADMLYGGERNVVMINMSEYQEAHTVSSLKGSPPGYVGYGEGGVLTEAVRRKPYSVVLLDEVEKAHPDVMELFYQVFDKGMLEDGEGREIDFKNTVILLTSNTATDTIMKLCADPDTKPEPEGLVEAIRPELIKVFKPALLGRMIVVPYYPISDDIMREIIKLQLGRIETRLADNHGAKFTYDESVRNEIASRCTEVESGARNVDHILTRTLLPEMSGEFLSRMSSGEPISRVHVTVEGGQFQYKFSNKEPTKESKLKISIEPSEKPSVAAT
ncbi:type VI secretion system ATPase TssH [Candidatus Nitrospira salsa]